MDPEELDAIIEGTYRMLERMRKLKEETDRLLKASRKATKRVKMAKTAMEQSSDQNKEGAQRPKDDSSKSEA